MASQLIFRAARRYFSDSERSDVERWDISAGDQINKDEPNIIKIKSENSLSKLSPLHKSSSIFFVIILVTSCKSSFNRSKLDPAVADAVRVS